MPAVNNHTRNLKSKTTATYFITILLMSRQHMHGSIRNNTSSRAVASTTQSEAVASVILFLLFPLFHEAGKEKKLPDIYTYLK